MAQVQLYAQQQNNGQYVALDLHIEEPIKLNLSVANIIDPTATNSTFSRTFRVPHTAVNGPFFEGVFNVNSLNFDASKKADAYILDNGIFFENGNIRLNAINVNSKDNSVEYEITFYGATSDFGSKIGGGFMNEIDLTQYNHTKSWVNISGSWTTTGGLFDGNVRYGLIEWGYTYNAQNQPNIPTLSTGFAKSFTNTNNPYLKDQWKPQIRAKAIWDQIFLEAGYTYDSVFLDSEFFKNQYVISDNVASATLNNSNLFSAERQGIYNTTIGQPFPWITPIEISDPGNNFTPSSTDSGIYTAPSTGNYDMSMKASEVEFYLYGGGQDIVIIGYEANVLDADTGISLSQYNDQWTFSSSNPGGQSLDADFNLYLQAGQRVRFQLRTFVISGQVSLFGTNIQFYGQSVECTQAPEVLSVNGIMPSNIRKIDFMKSIINRYRLVFVPSKFEANHFTIVPWKDWVLEGRSKDWTDRLDTSKDMVIKPLFFDQARFQIYKDQEDSDYLNYNYQLGIKQTFGQLNLDSTNELIKGTKEYKDQFAPTPLDGIGYIAGSFSEIEAASFLIPHMAKDTGGNGESVGTVSVGKREPIQPKLRLVFWNGMRSAPISWWAQNDTNKVQMYDYPLMSQYSNFPVTPTTFDLNWENELPLYNYELIAGVLTNPKSQTSFSCFNTFWKTWYDVTFDPYSRIVEAYFALDYNEILDLKFNDYIFVKDAWYFVNSVSDYVAGETSNCKVQLIKLGNNIGITLPVVTPPTYTAFETCYSQTDLCTAHCCATYAGAQNVTIYVNGGTLIDSTLAYQDATGGIIAAPGYYSNATGTIFVNSNGAILVQDASECDCVPVSYQFTVHLNTTGCEVCCNNGPLITVYGSNANFLQNGSFWTNALLTTPGPAGFYKQSGEGTALQVVANGSVVNNFLCSNCVCETYYPFTVCASTVLCDACCCFGGTSTVYGTNPTFANNTTLYSTNNGSQKVTNGFYKFNDTTVAQVTGGEGAVTAFSTCTTCTPCPAGPVEVTVNVSAEKRGYLTTTLLQKSYDNGASFVDVGTVTITQGQPANTQVSQVFTVENGVRLKAINSTTTVNGAMQTNYLINLDTFDNTTVQTPATVTLVVSSATNDEYTYEFNNIVTGGNDVEYDRFLAVGGQYTQYQTTTNLNDIAGLNATTAEFISSFNVITGFNNTSDPSLCRVESIVSYEDKVYVLGIFNEYKGQATANRIACLNLDGSLDTTFNTNAGSGLSANTDPSFGQGKLFMSPTGKLYVTGATDSYNGTTLQGFRKLFRLNLNGTLDTSFNVGTGINDNVSSIQFKTISGDEKLYLAGSFTRYNAPIFDPTLNASRTTSINSDGSINTAFNYGTGFTSAGDVTTDLFLFNDKLYYTISFGSGFIYNGVSYTGNVFSVNLDGTPNATFNSGVTTGFNNGAEAIQADSTGLYYSGEFASYNGTASFRVAKLNFDGTLNTTFNNNTEPFSPVGNRIEILAVSDGLYSWGKFNSYRSFASSNLVKINKTDGSPITAFNVGTGFSNPGDTDFVYTLSEVLYQTPPIVYPINISYSNESPCAAFCATPYNTVIYGNATTLVNSTILYANETGTSFAAPGWYSDGGTIAEVDGNGLIIGYTNVSTCNCNTLYQFDVTFDANLCVSCGGGSYASITVYGLNPNWSSNAVLYTNPQGTAFALNGYYAYNFGIALQVINNGNVVNTFDCTTDCGIGDCYAVYRIQNTSGNIISWNALSCIDEILYGDIYPGNFATTGVCIRQGSLNVIGGSYIATATDIC